MLAASFLFQRGTPFIYQGQEIGMTNIKLRSIDQYLDVSSKTNYNTYHLKEEPEKRLRRIHLSSRDSARTPLQWNSGKYAGFSVVKPWFYVNPNYKKINAADEEKDEYSILNFYRKCLNLRKHSRALLEGTYREYFPKDPNIYMYERRYENTRYLIICSFSKFPLAVRFPKNYRNLKGHLVLCNYPERDQVMSDNLREMTHQAISKLANEHGLYRPYEARVYRFRS
jgi:oligo-1,6-glucosidase